MSQQDTSETVNIPDAGSGGFANQEIGRSRSLGPKFLLFSGFIIVVLAGLVFYSNSQTVSLPSSISTDANLDSTPGGENQSNSPEFQEVLKQANIQNAQEAQNAGLTFIPTPENLLQPIDDLEPGTRIEEPEPKPEVVVAKPVPTPAREPAPAVVPPTPVTPPAVERPANAPGGNNGDGEENPYIAAIIGQMSSISGPPPSAAINISSTGTTRVAGEQGPGTAGQAGQGVANANAVSVASAASADVVRETVIIPAGELIYAETLTSTNSDLAGSPVLVELTTGEYRGSRLIGTFTVNEASDRMVIQFSSLTTPDGESYGVSAFAVDGVSAEVAVASGKDRRYLQRYAPILAAAFITSYAVAQAAPEQTLTTVGDETAVVEKQRTERQSLYAGLGAATAAIGADLVANAPKGPKIILRDGWPLAVLFTASVVASDG